MVILHAGRSPAVYRLKPGAGTDSYGDPVEDWENPVRERLYRATVQEPRTEEIDSAGKRVVSGERALYLPYASDLAAEDRIEIDGEVWRVEGRPKVRRGLAMGVYTSATLSRAEGGP